MAAAGVDAASASAARVAPAAARAVGTTGSAIPVAAPAAAKDGIGRVKKLKTICSNLLARPWQKSK